MKITLINPKSPFLEDQRMFPNLGILYLSASLKNRGHDVTFLDMTLLDKLPEITTSIVGITATGTLLDEALALAITIKEQNKDIFIILGGCVTNSILNKKNTIGLNKYDKYFDLIMSGECENKLVHFMDEMTYTTYRGKGNEYYKYYKDYPDVNSIPYPDRSLLTSDYTFNIEGKKGATLITSRGCPYKCAFCNKPGNEKLRVRTVENVIGEIEEIDRLGYKSLMIYDDIYASSKERVKDIGSFIKSKGMVYRCFTHVKHAKNVAEELANTNCKHVAIGIESGDASILETIKKGFTPDEGIEAVKVLKDAGLFVKVFLMVGLPGETQKSIENTKRWFEKAQPDDFTMMIYTPFPNTEIWDNKNKYDISWDDTGAISHYYESTIFTNSLTSQEIFKAKELFYEEYGNR